MTYMLEAIKTDKTDIINLISSKNDTNKKEVLDLDIVDYDLITSYVSKMFLYKGIWYYYKDDVDRGFSFCLSNELIGSYLAKDRGLPTVSFKIANIDGSNTLGLISPNFKVENKKYFLLSQIIKEDKKDKIERLLELTCDKKNYDLFLNHLFNLFALDIYMLQKDRCNVNLQFQLDINTNEFDLAPIYDYSNCASKVGIEEIEIPSKITKLDYIHIISLARKYPVFKEALERIMDEDMVKTWYQICDDYHFDMSGDVGKQIIDYYSTKEKNQKVYIKELLRCIR